MVRGTVQIEQKGTKLASVAVNNFIGEMTFLNFLLASNNDKNETSNQNVMGTMATADAVVESDEVVAYVWEFESLRSYLRKEREVRNALSAYLNHDLRAKLASLNVSAVEK